VRSEYILRSYGVVVRSREVFGEEICPVVRAAAPLDVEMPEYRMSMLLDFFRVNNFDFHASPSQSTGSGIMGSLLLMSE